MTWSDVVALLGPLAVFAGTFVTARITHGSSEDRGRRALVTEAELIERLPAESPTRKRLIEHLDSRIEEYLAPPSRPSLRERIKALRKSPDFLFSALAVTATSVVLLEASMAGYDAWTGVVLFLLLTGTIATAIESARRRE